MKPTFFLSLVALALSLVAAQSAQAHEVQIYLPGVQYRYENDDKQSVQNRMYLNYSLSTTWYERYIIGAEFNQIKTESSEGSSKINSHFQEYNIFAGYSVYSKILHEEYNIVFDLEPIIYLGSNRTTVTTAVGSVNEQSIGEDNLNFAAAGQASLKMTFFILRADIRYAYSRSYDPSSVVIYGLRAGFRIGF